MLVSSAGEGEVTEKFRTGGGFDVVVATEASAPMVRRLRQKAFDVVLESTDVSCWRSVLRAKRAGSAPPRTVSTAWRC